MGGFLGLLIVGCCIGIPAVMGVYAIATARRSRKENNLGDQAAENNVQATAKKR